MGNKTVGPQVWERSALGRLSPLWGAGALGVLVGCVAATEYIAWSYGGSPKLGASWYGLYPPWMAFVWAWQWQAWNPGLYREAAGIGVCVTAASFAWSAIVGWQRKPSGVSRYLRGSARWATKREARQMGLFAKEGICVGGWAQGKGATPLYHDGPEHVALIAPSGSGKGVSIIVPTLLKWTESVVVMDMKGELAALTAPCRKERLKNRVLIFEPAATSRSCGFNAFEEIRTGTDHEVADAQQMAALLVDPQGKGLRSSSNEGHWNVTASDLLTGCIMHHAFEATKAGKVPSLPGLSLMLSDPDKPMARVLDAMVDNQSLPGFARKAAAMAAEEQRSRPEKEGGSVLSYARKTLGLFRDPIVARNVERSSFRVADLMHADEPVSLYIIVQIADMERMVPLVCILLNMIVLRLAVKPQFEQGRPKASYKHPLLLALDEFTAWGDLRAIANAMAYFRGFGIRVLLSVQDVAQLRERYGDNESITSNCGIQIAFAPNKVDTAKHLSEMLGTSTVIKRSPKGSSNGSDQVDEVSRPLLTVDECLRIPGAKKEGTRLTAPGDLVVCVAGHNPLYGRQVPYFMHPDLNRRSALTNDDEP